MYGSHDMRHKGFPRVNGLSTDPQGLGRHSNILGILASFSPNFFFANCFLLRKGDFFFIILDLKSPIYNHSIFFFLNKVIIPHQCRFSFVIFFVILLSPWCTCGCRRLSATGGCVVSI